METAELERIVILRCQVDERRLRAWRKSSYPTQMAHLVTVGTAHYAMAKSSVHAMIAADRHVDRHKVRRHEV